MNILLEKYSAKVHLTAITNFKMLEASYILPNWSSIIGSHRLCIQHLIAPLLQQEHTFRIGLFIKVSFKIDQKWTPVFQFSWIYLKFIIVQKETFLLKFEVMMTTTMTIAAIPCVTTCVLVEIYWRFRSFCLLHHQFLSFRFLFHYHISPPTIQQNSSDSRTVPGA